MNSSRRLLIVAFSILLLTCGASSQESTPRIVDRGPHHARWERVTHVVDDQGRAEWTTNAWTQLESGMHYWDSDLGAWEESQELIEITPHGAVARHGLHRVIFSTNVNDPHGAVDIEVDHKVRLRSSVLALRYFDPATGLFATIAVVKDQGGELLPPNQIIYRNAFDGVNADVLYTYRKRGLEADVILREIPPSPIEVGLNPVSDAVRIEVVTEFFDPPIPEKTERFFDRVEDPTLREAVAEPDWIDEELDFGPNRIGSGRAFSWSAREAAAANPEDFTPVAKRWIPQKDGRTILIEAVEYVHLFDDLVALPGSDARRKSLRARELLAPRREVALAIQNRLAPRSLSRSTAIDLVAAGGFPKRKSLSGVIGASPTLTVASTTTLPDYGLVLDWSSMNSIHNNFTFQGDETYYVTGSVTLTGTTTLEGGTVVKFPKNPTNSPSLWVVGSLACKTSAYSPAVFTAEDDNSIGQSIVAGDPDPASSYGHVPLGFSGVQTSQLIEYVRIRHGNYGLYFAGSVIPHTVRHCQFVECRVPIAINTNATIRLQNTLIDRTRGIPASSSATMFWGSGATIVGENLTLHQSASLFGGTGNTLVLTNSLLVGITNVSAYSGSANILLSSPTGVFDPVGAGRFYLARNSPYRNAGTSSIDPTLAEALRSRTTYAPETWTDAITLDSLISPRVPRDYDTPDLGYHYDPIDLAINEVVVTNASCIVTNGAAIAAFGTSGFVLREKSTLISRGSPERPNTLTRFSTVQEQSYPWGGDVTSLCRLISVQAEFPSAADLPKLELHHTVVSMPATSTNSTANRELVRIEGAYAISPLSLSHCRVIGTHLRLANPAAARYTIGWSNNLFERCRITFHDPPGANVMDISLANNLFVGGRIDLYNNEGLGSWSLRDNQFASDSVVTAGSFLALSNAATAGVSISGVAAFGSGIRTGLVANFVSGPFGRFYYPITGPTNGLNSLLNQGSRTANQAGLYHYTIRSDQTPEANSIVDVGFHYPSTGATSTGLVALYEFEEGVGTTTADGSGNGHTGTLYNGAAWTNGRRGRGVAFDGNNDYVGVPDAPALRLTQPFTIAAWVRKVSEMGHWQPYLMKQSSLTTRNYWLGDWIGASGVADGSFWDTAGEQHDVLGTSHLPVGTWAHLTWTWDGTSQRLYVDGTQEGTVSSGNPPVTSSAPLAIGGYHYQAGSLNGVMDEVRLYNRVLSASEVRALANPGLADTDADGLPDATEDANGDGIADPGESDWTQSTSGPGATLKVYTPLR